jgi:hypothetical protein
VLALPAAPADSSAVSSSRRCSAAQTARAAPASTAIAGRIRHEEQSAGSARSRFQEQLPGGPKQGGAAAQPAASNHSAAASTRTCAAAAVAALQPLPATAALSASRSPARAAAARCSERHISSKWASSSASVVSRSSRRSWPSVSAPTSPHREKEGLRLQQRSYCTRKTVPAIAGLEHQQRQATACVSGMYLSSQKQAGGSAPRIQDWEQRNRRGWKDTPRQEKRRQQTGKTSRATKEYSTRPAAVA